MLGKLTHQYRESTWDLALNGGRLTSNRRVGSEGQKCPRCKRPAHSGPCPAQTPPPSPSISSKATSESGGGTSDGSESRVGAKSLSLTTKERKLLKQHMPQHQGHNICLAYNSHAGCTRETCGFQHVSLTSPNLHYTVKLFLASKSGLKNKNKLSKTEAQSAQKALRDAEKVKQDKNVADGKTKATPKSASAKSETRKKLSLIHI